jgi:hypothetical protein
MDHRGDGALAVGARDVEREKRALRMIERFTEMTDVLETQLDAEGLEREKPIQQ